MSESITLIFENGADAELETQGVNSDDVAKVISAAEDSGRKLKNEDSGHFLAKLRIEKFTAYVEYTMYGSDAHIYDVYSHMVTIKEEGGV